MPDIATISTLLSSVKTATDIAKFIKDSNSSLQDAEAKLKVAELIGALADVKLEVASLNSSLQEKDQEIFLLKEQLLKKESLRFDGRLYWAENDNIPFCPVCLERDNKHHHLTYNSSSSFYDHRPYYDCKICNNNYIENA